MVITIGGEYGSGAKRIAEELSGRMQFLLADNETVAEMVEKIFPGYSRESFTYFDESTGYASVSAIEKKSKTQEEKLKKISNHLSDDTLPLNQQIAQSQREVLNHLADEGNCIILGRCADYYLKDRADVVSVWCGNTLSNRIRRVSEFYEIEEKAALAVIDKVDKRRSEYYQYFTNQDWRSLDNYHLVLNVGKIGIAGCIDLLEDMVKIASKEHQPVEVRVPDKKVL